MDKTRSLLERTFVIAKNSFEKGNLPFGCLLADASGKILIEAENTVNTDTDSIAHCEINLVHNLKEKYSAAFLSDCTLYASTEPCPMCAGAIFWSGIGHIIFALGKDRFHQLAGTENPAHKFDIRASELLQYGGRIVTVTGPLMEDETIIFYQQLLKGSN
ncbi:MAG: nucleoside deaminase [Bacteroidetes bacterium]|nr:nucleoside deaminase [Bacteroidota bacterium]